MGLRQSVCGHLRAGTLPLPWRRAVGHGPAVWRNLAHLHRRRVRFMASARLARLHNGLQGWHTQGGCDCTVPRATFKRAMPPPRSRP